MGCSDRSGSVILSIMKSEGLEFDEIMIRNMAYPSYLAKVCPFCQGKDTLIVYTYGESWGCSKCMAGMKVVEYSRTDREVGERPEPEGDIFDFIQQFKQIESLEQAVYYLQDTYKIFGETKRHTLNQGYYSRSHKMNDYDTADHETYSVVGLYNWR